MRILLEALPSTGGAAGRKRSEVRWSLRTKNAELARLRASRVNWLLERTRTMTDRRTLLEALGGIRAWTIDDNGVSADGPEDTDDLLRVLREFPQLLPVLRGTTGVPAPANEVEQRMRERIRQVQSEEGLPEPTHGAKLVGMPANPMRLSEAIQRFRTSMEASAQSTSRTAEDRGRLLARMRLHLREELGEDPLVHEVRTHHLSAFLDAVPVRRAGETGEGAGSNAAAPKTVIKKISDLRSFFAFAHQELQATRLDPTAGLEKRRKALNSASTKQERHYRPFETSHLQRIFQPKTYLAANNQADEFWAPLLGLHLGTRLKEVVTLTLEDIGRHEATGIWYIDVKPENAKNANSVRRLPVSDRLVQLGFIEYVAHVRALGATYLFPHQDVQGSTWLRDPSKNVSRKFGSYLDQLGLSHPDLVFHSFRHTVVTSLQDGGTPIQDSMQITGHQAQDHAIRTGHLTAAQSRSVHVSTYTHADKARMNIDYPLARLKEHLDRCIDVCLDYRSLRRAADIVKEHTVKDSVRFRSGWPTLRRAYTAEMLQSLEQL